MLSQIYKEMDTLLINVYRIKAKSLLLIIGKSVTSSGSILPRKPCKYLLICFHNMYKGIYRTFLTGWVKK